MDLDNFTIDSLLNTRENDFYDRKSEMTKPKEIAKVLVAFANSSGGMVSIGITNNEITGLNKLKNEKISDFVQIGIDHCHPALKIKHKFIDVVNKFGNDDQILLISVDPSIDKVYTTKTDEAYIRVGDETKKLSFEMRKDLEYEKDIRRYESELVSDCLLEDLDQNLLNKYKDLHNYKGENVWKLLYSKGLAKRDEYKNYTLTVAGTLCLAETPTIFLPNSRVRFIRYDGIKEQTGSEMNVIKNESVEAPLPILIDTVSSIIEGQLRDFNFLDAEKGQFVKVSEYPKEAWLEGLVNAVTHRSYSISGDDIRIIMFDDRLEFHSPGKFPSIVTPDNIKEIHYSRNPQIAKNLNDWGYVREFGEGVNRMFKEMANFYLEEPQFEQKENSILLTLKNNIVMRSVRRQEGIKFNSEVNWNELNNYEQKIMELAYQKEKIKTADVVKQLNIASPTARKYLEALKEKGGLVKIANSPQDPHQHYIFKL
ncbi:putative DNA binding domain-containing protein [Staphylococcus epidermidis]|uniref:ATP-binding protein n=1 Tax=Staphylococcus epidermidis TaxID=1282 RepID=UPI001E4AE1DD|nr:ATP-binding protein [Staphylococcus epidermidis]MCD9073669.1 putative DNA binding domain-containing protein [Staphylococcus epidermidis]